MSNREGRFQWLWPVLTLCRSPGHAGVPWWAATLGGPPGEVLQASLSCFGGICRSQGLDYRKYFSRKNDHVGPLATKLDPVPCFATDMPCGFSDGTLGDLPLPILWSKDLSTAFLHVWDYPCVMARHFTTLNSSSATSLLSRELFFKSTGRLHDPQKTTW